MASSRPDWAIYPRLCLKIKRKRELGTAQERLLPSVSKALGSASMSKGEKEKGRGSVEG